MNQTLLLTTAHAFGQSTQRWKSATENCSCQFGHHLYIGSLCVLRLSSIIKVGSLFIVQLRQNVAGNGCLEGPKRPQSRSKEPFVQN